MPISNIRKIRLKKLKVLREAGIDPYPIKSNRTHTISELVANFEKLAKTKQRIIAVGRIRSIRIHGGVTFIHFEDESSKIQAYFEREKLGPKKYKFFLENFDIGDFLQISGTLFKTKRKEKTIAVSDFVVLAKSLLPLPEKWHGLKDVEERFRKRYLDLIMNPEVKEKFKLRSRIIQELRNVFESAGFLEVETPVLQPISGGALAKPFKTYLNALKLNLFLRISPELYLKRLLVGGFEKIYEIGRNFRNEGIDAYHNPEFTLLELYWAFQDKDGLMRFIEEFLSDLAKKIKKSFEISYQGQKINFKRPFQRITFKDLIKKYCQIDIERASLKDLQKKLKDLGIKFEKKAVKSDLYDILLKKACQKHLVQPTFVILHPIEMAVLAKRSFNPKYADRFQLFVGGIELINGFSELNDPLEQEQRFKTKISPERRDKDFLEALSYGMPSAAGMGMGVDRLVAVLTDSRSLREIILFPTMRPK